MVAGAPCTAGRAASPRHGVRPAGAGHHPGEQPAGSGGPGDTAPDAVEPGCPVRAATAAGRTDAFRRSGRDGTGLPPGAPVAREAGAPVTDARSRPGPPRPAVLRPDRAPSRPSRGPEAHPLRAPPKPWLSYERRLARKMIL